MPKWTFAAVVVLGAFLLFQVQPVVGKAILPWFGGSAMVWTTCMLLFQSLLLAGYAYAHLTSRMAPWRQAVLHAGLLAVALCGMRWLSHPLESSAAMLPPAAQIVLLLLPAIGPAFVLLSAGAPLVQRWYCAANGTTPYRLYALSNAGSLAGLLAYPLLIEPAWSLDQQQRFWTIGFTAYVVLCGLLAWGLARQRGSGTPMPGTPAEFEEVEAGRSAGAGQCVLWLLLSAAPAALLLAVTSKISLEVAPIPLLWVVPLALYLLTFVIAFDRPRWYRPRAALWLLLLSLIAVGWLLRQPNPYLVLLACVLWGALFFGCLVCHGELARQKPHPRYLTGYFLAVSAGGVLGSLFVALVAPRVFQGLDELPLALATCLVLGAAAQPDSPPRNESFQSLWRWALVPASALAACVWLNPQWAGWLQEPFHAAWWMAQGPAELLPWFAAVGVALAVAWTGLDADPHIRLHAAPTRCSRVLKAIVAVTTTLAAMWLAMGLARTAARELVPMPTDLGSLAFNPLLVWGVVSVAAAARFRWSEAAAVTISHRGRQIPTAVWAPAAFAMPSSMWATGMLVETSIDSLWPGILLVGAMLAPLLLRCCRALTAAGQRRLSAVLIALLLLQGLVVALVGAPVATTGVGQAYVASQVLVCAALAAGQADVSGAHRPAAVASLIAGVAIGLLAGIGFLPAVAAFVPLTAFAAALAVCLWDVDARLSHRLRRNLLLAGCIVLVAASCALMPAQRRGRVVAESRNFYGMLQVIDEQGFRPTRLLIHGRVPHGMEFLDSNGRSEPTSYYATNSGAGRLLALPSAGPRRVGLIGLGVGTLAYYGRPGDRFQFFEIDPDVVDYAHRYFRFLEQSPAELECIVADGRLALTRETGQFDCLLVDAFSGDAIPAHLLTAEAFDLYLSRLRPKGALAIHLSNTHLDLTPVVTGHARRLGLELVYLYNEATPVCPRSLWAVLSREAIDLGPSASKPDVGARTVDWSDQYHSLLPLLRWRGW